MHRKRLYIIALLLALLIPTAIVAAAESVIVDGVFKLDLVGHEPGPDDTEIFTYAVTDLGSSNALSHWTLGIDTCLEHLVDPLDGPYSTVTNIPECSDGTYSCQAANYTVETGSDPTLGIHGIKFEEGTPQLSTDTTHVFQITVKEFSGLEEIEVGVKYGSNQPPADPYLIDGPRCGVPTAVSLASTNVNSAPLGTLLPVLFGLMILLAGATFFVLRRAQIAAASE